MLADPLALSRWWRSMTRPIRVTGSPGSSSWTSRYTEGHDHAEATYDWRISAEKPLLRYGSFVFRPIFAANHRWAMAHGEESLDLEVRRRRGEKVPAPPGPAFARR